MKIYLFRHAKSARDDFPEDSHDWPIADEGRNRHRAVTRGMQTIGFVYTPAWVSPLKRARQTYEVMARELQSDSPGEKQEALSPMADLDGLLELLDGLYAECPDAGLIIVGHNPQVSALLGLLGGAGTPHMRTSDMAYITWDDYGPKVGSFHKRESLIALGRND